MQIDVKQIVMECFEQLLRERAIDTEPDLNMEMSRENGIDSLGIVSLVLSVEEKLGTELDQCLAEIRKCKTIQEFITVVENIVVNN